MNHPDPHISTARPIPEAGFLKVSREDVDHFGRTHAQREAAQGPDRVPTFSGRKRNMSSPMPSIHVRRIEPSHGAPPPDVLDQIAAAGGIQEGLREAGFELRFSTPRPGARVSIELCDLEGNPMRIVSVGEALEIAAGTVGVEG
jgi:hypothetical protein